MRLNLSHEPRVRVIMLSFLGVAQDFPGLDDFVEFVFTLAAVGVFIRMVLQNESFILLFQLLVSNRRINLKRLIVILFTVNFELAKPAIYLPLILQNAQAQYEHNEEYRDAFATGVWSFQLLLHLFILPLLLLFSPLLFYLLLLELLLSLALFFLFLFLFVLFLLSLFLDLGLQLFLLNRCQDFGSLLFRLLFSQLFLFFLLSLMQSFLLLSTQFPVKYLFSLLTH